MRIIAGEYRGKRLNVPKDNNVRPTTDKVKEAVFSILESYVDIEEAVIGDLFAGTGNLGLEAISRGASFAYLSDNNGESIKLIKENIGICKGASEYIDVSHGSYKRALEKILKDEKKGDVFFVDPPYHLKIQKKVLEEISEMDLLSDEGIVFVEHDKNIELDEKIGTLTKFKEKKYGIIHISVFKKHIRNIE